MTLCLSRESKIAQGLRDSEYEEVGEKSEMSHKADFLMSEGKEKPNELGLFNPKKTGLRS